MDCANYTKFKDMKIRQKAMLVAIVAFGVMTLWFFMFGEPVDGGGCRPGHEVTAAECGYDDY